MSIESKLDHLSKAELVNLIVRLRDLDEGNENVIDRHLSAASLFSGDEAKKEETKTLKAVLMHQLQQLELEREYIGYQDSFAYACRLESILSDIDPLLREQNLEQAIQVTEAFIALGQVVIENCDDSDGQIGDVFRHATELWLDIAAELRSVNPDARDWLSQVRHFFDNNDYGLLDDIIPFSSSLLTHEELEKLAWQFEKEARQALKKPKNKGHNYEAFHACIGIKCVAEALDSIDLYEKAILLTSPIPNTLQLADLIRFAIGLGAFERAEHWLEQVQWQEDPRLRKQLRNELLKTKGDITELKENLSQEFVLYPTEYNLRGYWALADSDERIEVINYLKNTEKSLAQQDPQNYISMLLLVGSLQNAEKVLTRSANQLSKISYRAIIGWLEYWPEKKYLMANIVCYRLLLTDLLERGYSKAYHHGARYFNKLLELDKEIDDYQDLETSTDFITQLQVEHWRKRSFWQAADYPNKS